MAFLPRVGGLGCCPCTDQALTEGQGRANGAPGGGVRSCPHTQGDSGRSGLAWGDHLGLEKVGAGQNRWDTSGTPRPRLCLMAPCPCREVVSLVNKVLPLYIFFQLFDALCVSPDLSPCSPPLPRKQLRAVSSSCLIRADCGISGRSWVYYYSK